ncbi:anaphase-promoting complex subunit 15 isoform X2 [Bacillus rossius redtenbacheri]|uniref:anaphase-promoting complex subunit 15 isoform X2 n=1 Tax=Bacillus rossius redtenbacheri TaxID=93214 RepID=UPI002FDECF06
MPRVFQPDVSTITHEDSDVIPIGKAASEHVEEEEEDDEEEDDNDDDSDSHDDEEDEELDMEVTYERESPVDVGMQLSSGSGHGVRFIA